MLSVTTTRSSARAHRVTAVSGRPARSGSSTTATSRSSPASHALRACERIEALRVEPPAHPLDGVPVLGMARIGKYLEEAGIPVRPPAVLGRAGSRAVQAGRRLGGAVRPHPDLVLPPVAE